MNLKQIGKITRRVFRENQIWIVPVVAAVGVGVTGYLSAAATAKAIDETPREDGETVRQHMHRAAKDNWTLYGAAAATGLTTTATVVFGSYASNKRLATAVSAAKITETTFNEYRKAVVKELGEKKERVVSEQVAVNKVKANPPTDSNVIIVAEKTVTCCELYTGRYFKSDMETLKQSVNEINHRILNELYVSMDEFYDLLGLEHTTTSDGIGWDSDRLLELEYATVLHDDTPCLTFSYNYTKTF